MVTVLYALLVISGLFLIILILLQAGKGAGAGLSIGGGMSQTMFGGSGGQGFFLKLTAALAAIFMVLCLTLAKIATRGSQEYKGLMAGATAPAAAAPAAPESAPAAQPAQPKPFKADVPAAAPVAPAPAAPAKK